MLILLVLSHDVAWFDTISPAELPTRMTEDVSKVGREIAGSVKSLLLW